MSKNSTENCPVSQGIVRHANIIGKFTTFGCALIGVSIGFLVAYDQSRDERITAAIIGGAVGLIVGGFFSSFFLYLIKGFAVIVAWYESTPRGYTSIVRPDAAPQPVTYMPPSGAPQMPTPPQAPMGPQMPMPPQVYNAPQSPVTSQHVVPPDADS